MKKLFEPLSWAFVYTIAIPGGDPLEQLEFPMELNPDEDGLWLLGDAGPLGLLADDVVASEETDKDVLKWCLLPDRTAMIMNKWDWEMIHTEFDKETKGD